MTDIAWVVNSPFDVSSYSESLFRAGIGTKYLCQTDLALEELVKRTKYSLIVTDLEIAPGNCSEPYIQSVLKEAQGRPPYWKIALKMIDLIRSHHSVNHDTPIVVATAYHPERSGSFPQAKKICQSHGVSEYLYLPHLEIKRFYELILPLVK